MNRLSKNKHLIVVLFFFAAILVFSCRKSNNNPGQEEADPKKDRWEYGGFLADSSGNTYFVANTYDNRLQIRVKDKEGKTIFSEYCPTIDSAEIPVSAEDVSRKTSNVGLALTAPNKYISINDATLAVTLYKGEKPGDYNQVQLLANINLESKELYTKKYKIQAPLDWSFVTQNNAVVQWYQNTLLVREGTESDLRGGGFMGLGSRGTQLVCYERNFSVRWTKDIDVNAASFPRTGGTYIPISDMDRIGVGIETGVVARISILVSREDEWRGVKPIVWQVDLKKTYSLPQDYSVKVTDYNIEGTKVLTTCVIYDASGKLTDTKTGEWDLGTGMPRKQL